MGTKLKKMRESRGMSQSQLSKATGISYRCLQYYEQGRLNFDHARLNKIIAAAIALKCKIEDLIENPQYIELIKKYNRL